ncbi:2-succinyl-5-enolpyruvyl-6-hydroxy-3-cyclohexene-1-carboxylic-acid synthase [Rubrivirga sp. IMCC45206]|uniref:2-succinyl-5-enolpyruvyl-6-hydroxy-3- cyclohexene-1-carboxylic-acid synthase n=1 Tax=Rubrivirga sp. IMCC45206 TaxID=3391614 RepID=UPI00399034C7
MTYLTAAPNINHLWAALLVEELVRQGTTLFVVCPGSRSTPLAVAVASNPRADVLVHWDERAAGFVALGWGRATGRPAAVITTSGTAAANLLPAAVEADADGVPLLLLTADRPQELRATGANQTIRQPPIFQDVARWALDWPVPSPDVPARWVLSTAAHAVHRASQPAGPVHLNLPFREPLAATPDGTDTSAALGDVSRWVESGAPFVRQHAPVGGARVAGDEPGDALVAELWSAERGLVVLGPGADGRAATVLADRLGWPLVADVRAERPLDSDSLVAHADLLLASPAALDALRPDAVVHVGDGRLTSKRLARLLATVKPQIYVQLSPTADRRDPDSLVTDRFVGPPTDLLAALQTAVEDGESSWRRGDWRERWATADRAAVAVLAGLPDDLSEIAVARAVTATRWRTVVAASMPIRDVEAFVAAGAGEGVVANRGASGIDGTVATAHGLARGLGKPIVLLLGDLALLHDQTSLALLREGPPVTVVVVNNDGGGIFHRLPVASGPGAVAPDTFERMFGTPHGLVFRDAAAQVGLAYHAPETLAALRDAFAHATASGASALIEVRTDRAEQTALRARIEADVAGAVDAALA